MSEYIQSIKCIVDKLAAVANPVVNSDLTSTLLSGLSLEYDSFVTSINIRVDPVLSKELISLILSQEIYRGRAITIPDSTSSSPFLPRFIPPPAFQATTRLQLPFVVVDMAEAGRTIVVVDVPSYHHISPPITDLNTRSAIILAIMLANATIVMIIFLLQLAPVLFSTFMGIVQLIPTGMLTPEPLIT